MKVNIQRRVVVLVTLVALLACMVFPASATEIDNTSGWIDVLDYGYASGSNYNRIAFTGSKTISFNLPQTEYLYNIDFIAKCSSPLTAEVIKGSNVFPLKSVAISNGYVRYYGDIHAPSYSSLSIRFTGDSSTYYTVDVLTCNVSTLSLNSFEDVGTIDLYPTNTTKMTATMAHSSAIAYIQYAGGGMGFQLQAYSNNWKKYDYLDFIVTFTCGSITSVNAYFGDIVLDFECSSFENPTSIDEYGRAVYELYVRIDLTGLDRNSSDVPIVEFNGLIGDTNTFKLTGVNGYIIVEDTNPWFYWFTNLKSFLNEKFTSIRTAITNLWTNIHDFFATEFNRLISWIDSGFDSVVSNLKSGFDSVVSKLDELVNGSEEQQAAAEQMKENAVQQGQQVDSVVNGMQFATPDPGSIDASAGTMTGGLDFSLYNNALVAMSGSGTVYQVLFIAVTLMMVSYLFFGKRV